MDKICKYYKYQKYVSYDNGATWQPLNEYQKGELMQFNSEDCGGGIGTLYKWVVVDGEYECNGYDKYQKTQKYVSYDNGVTYNPVSPAVYSIGVLIENNSADCGYIPTPTAGTKWIASYQNSYGSYTTKSKECDNTIIGSNEVPYSVNQTGIGIDSYTYLIKSVSIGECVKWIGYPNTDYGSFQNFDTLTSVTIPNSVRTINNFAFSGCHSLTGVTIPNSVVAIGYAAFNSCYSIQNVVIPNSVVNVAPPQGQNVDNYGVFGNCSALTSCTLSVNMTRIPENMFRNSGLLSIDIPTNITGIGQYAFYNCSGLTSITIYATTPPTLGSNAFDYTNNCPIYVPCESVSSYINSWGSLSARIRGIEPCNPEIMVYVTYIDGSRDNYVKYCDDTDTSIYIPDADSAETVTYGDCVTSIDNRAFENRYNLKSVTISNSVTSIGNRAFCGCDGLTSVQLGDSLISIGDCAFSGCSKAFTSLELKNGVSVGNYAFAYCGTLKSATIDTNSIGSDVFRECTALNSIDIGSSTTTISDYMFTDCYSLRSVTIPDSVTRIGYYAFGYCRYITSITINAVTPPTLGSGAFYGISDYIIYVPAASVDVYKAASEWSLYADKIKPIPNS